MKSSHEHLRPFLVAIVFLLGRGATHQHEVIQQRISEEEYSSGHSVPQTQVLAVSGALHPEHAHHQRREQQGRGVTLLGQTHVGEDGRCESEDTCVGFRNSNSQSTRHSHRPVWRVAGRSRRRRPPPPWLLRGRSCDTARGGCSWRDSEWPAKMSEPPAAATRCSPGTSPDTPAAPTPLAPGDETGNVLV